MLIIHKSHAAAHGREADPRVSTRYQFAHELKVHTDGIALAVNIARITNAHILSSIAL